MQKEHIIGQLKYIILHICRFQCIIESFFSFEGTVSFCPLDEGRLSKINHTETNLKSLQTNILARYTSLNITMCGYSLLYCLAQHHSNQNVNYMVPPTPVNYVHHCMQFTFWFNHLKQQWIDIRGAVLTYLGIRHHTVPLELHNHAARMCPLFNGSFHYIINLSILAYLHTEWTRVRLNFTPDLECER